MSEKPPLPAGWSAIALGDAGVWLGGGTPSKSNPKYWTNGTVPWVSPKDMKVRIIRSSEDRITSAAVRESATRVVPKNSVLLVTRSGILEHSLPIAVNAVSVTLNQDLKAIVPREGIEYSYLAWVLAAFEQRILDDCRKGGTTVASIETSLLQRFKIPLAPPDEQRRIVAAIEAHLSALDAAMAGLERARERIARYQVSFLRQRIWRADETARERRLVPLRTLFDSIDQGWSPKCESIPAGGDEWGVIKTTAVQHMEYRDAEHKRLPRSFEPRPGIEIRVGDLLVTRKGPRARAGVACAVSQTRHKLMACDTVYRIRVNRERVTPQYLAIAMSETTILRAIDSAKAGISESGVSLTHERLGAVEVPLPSLEQQMLIEADCEQMLSATRRCESEIDMQLLRAVRLRQSILKSAFDGKLVPQDASVSKASALSERVLAREADSSIPVNQPRVRAAKKSSRRRSNA